MVWTTKIVVLKKGDKRATIKDYEIDKLHELMRQGFRVVGMEKAKPELWLGKPVVRGSPDALD